MASDTAIAHPHATEVAVYPALFFFFQEPKNKMDHNPLVQLRGGWTKNSTIVNIVNIVTIVTIVNL